MRSRIILWAAIVAAMGLAGCEAQHQKHDHERRHARSEEMEATETRITLEQVPANVRQAFEREFPGARVKAVEKETYRSGTVHYEFEFVTADGAEMEVEFNEDGDRLPEH